MALPVLSNLDFGGTAKATNLLDGTNPQDSATVAQLNSAIQGLAWKDSVRAASVANVTVAVPGATIDGVTMATNDRVLLKNQTTTTENGLYIFTGAAVAMTRTVDGDTFAELEGAVVTAEEGTNAGTTWRQTQVNGVIGTNTVTWTAFGTSAAAASETTAGIAELATQAETDAGTDDLRIVTPLKLATYSGRKLKFSQTIGDGSATSIAVTHNLGTKDVEVECWEVGGSFRKCVVEVQTTTTNSVTLLFASAPATNALRVVVLG